MSEKRPRSSVVIVPTTRSLAITFTFAWLSRRSPGAGPPTSRRVPLIRPMIAGHELEVSVGELVEFAAEPTHPPLATRAETQKMIRPVRRMVF